MHGLRISPFILLMKKKSWIMLENYTYPKKKNHGSTRMICFLMFQWDVLMEQRRCDLVGLYLLSKLENLIDHTHVGLYRDDWLAVVNLSGVQIRKAQEADVQIIQVSGSFSNHWCQHYCYRFSGLILRP